MIWRPAAVCHLLPSSNLHPPCPLKYSMVDVMRYMLGVHYGLSRYHSFHFDMWVASVSLLLSHRSPIYPTGILSTYFETPLGHVLVLRYPPVAILVREYRLSRGQEEQRPRPQCRRNKWIWRVEEKQKCWRLGDGYQGG
jgi:hypothetical protein